MSARIACERVFVVYGSGSETCKSSMWRLRSSDYGLVWPSYFRSADPRRQSTSQNKDPKSADMAHISTKKSDCVWLLGFQLGSYFFWPG